MDAEILAAERADHQRSKRKARGLLYGGMMGLFTLIGLITTIAMWAAMDAAALIFFVMFVGIAGFSVGLGLLIAKAIASATQNQHGLASPGPWSFGQVHTSAPAEQVWAALHQTVGMQGMSSHQTSPTTIEAIKTMGFWTPGARYLIDLRPSTDRPGMGVVTIAARPQIGYAMHDMGIAQNAVNAMLMAVPGRSQLPGAQFPTTPQDRFRSSQPQLPSAAASGVQAPLQPPGQQPYGQQPYPQPVPGQQPFGQPAPAPQPGWQQQSRPQQ